MAFSYFYSYVKFSEKNGSQRPIVPIKIEGYDFTGLLDSGSDTIVLPREVAEALEIKSSDKTELSQLDGSSMNCEIAEVNFEFGKGREVYPFKSKILIADCPRIVLGRKGFFNNFKITFEDDKGIIHFRKVERIKQYY